jgi:hypothetical protein
MTSRDFCFWLQGFFELQGAGPKPPEPFDANALHGYQAQMIKNHLALVFKHEIDPSMGPPSHQNALNHLHNGGDGDVKLRC